MSKAKFNSASKAESIAKRAGLVSGMFCGRMMNSLEDGCRAIAALARGDIPAFQTLGISAIKAVIERAPPKDTAPMQVPAVVLKQLAEEKGRGVTSTFKRAHTKSFEQVRKPSMAAKAPTLKPA